MGGGWVGDGWGMGGGWVGDGWGDGWGMGGQGWEGGWVGGGWVGVGWGKDPVANFLLPSINLPPCRREGGGGKTRQEN
jgi:hypothetical protein